MFFIKNWVKKSYFILERPQMFFCLFPVFLAPAREMPEDPRLALILWSELMSAAILWKLGQPGPEPSSLMTSTGVSGLACAGAGAGVAWRGMR